MSITTCDECGEFIDSDDDPNCFWSFGVYCEKCRDKLEDCTCRVPLARPTDIDPPERKRDPWCPTHGWRDADRERDEHIEREYDERRNETGGDE